MLKPLITAAAIMLGAMPAMAQIQTIDPNQADAYRSPNTQVPYDREEGTRTVAPESDMQAAEDDYSPVASQPPSAAESAVDRRNPDAFNARNIPVSQTSTVPAGELMTAAEGVFGRGARGLGRLIENILRDQGEPIAYIAGQEAGGAFIFGLRYGSGMMHHRIEGQRRVHWTGPSIGFDVGGNADKVFILVYNLHDAQRLFRRYPQAEGTVHFVGGFGAQYLRRGDVVLIPIRLGVGWRLGANAGYMRFSERSRWLPF